MATDTNLKVIDLNVDYGIDRSKDENKDAPSDIENTAVWIGQVIGLGYKEGLNTDKRRIWTTLQLRLQDHVTSKDPIFKVNEYELLFLRQAFEKAIVPANLSAAITKVEGAILDAKLESEIAAANPGE